MVGFSSKKLICFSLIIIIFLPLVNLNLYYNFINLRKDVITEELHLSNGDLEVDLSNLPDINYTLLNQMWYNPKIEMLIITPDDINFINAVKPLMEWKNEKGVKTIILSNFSLYEGRDTAEKIRNMIKEYYEKEGIRWVLLAGDAQDDLIPIRKVYNPDVIRWEDGSSETVGNEYYKPTDFYYAELDGNWDSDEDGQWGEAPQDNAYNLDEISWDPEVYVGRLPADNANELEIMVNKTLRYETNPDVGDWMNRMLLAGGVSSYFPQEYESKLTSYIIKNYAKDEVNYTHLVKEEGNLTESTLKNYFNDGYSSVIMAGHGGFPQYYYCSPSEIGYRSSDATSSTNLHKPSLVYLDACTLSSYDYNDNSIGETLIKREDGGAIGAIGGLRVTWYLEYDDNLEKLNRGNAKLFWKEFFENNKYQQGRALYDSKVAYINSDYFNRGETSTNYDFERKNILTYCLLGDPELDIYTDKPKVALNPFIDPIYEGQLVSVILRDINGKVIPYGRIHLTTSDGKYYTAYGDENGLVDFRLPAQANEFYNVIITGHNLVPTYFNFTTIADKVNPQVLNTDMTPKQPSIINQINFSVEAYDRNSGIESVYVLLSKNNFDTYSYYGSLNNYDQNIESFIITTGKLSKGEYSYCFVVRDYANNIITFHNDEFTFTVSETLIGYLFISSTFIIIAVAGISIFIFFKSFLSYSRIIKDFESLD